jgi:hypothetical protein
MTKKERYNPNWVSGGHGRYIGKTYFHCTGTIHSSKEQAQAEAEKWRDKGHKARVIKTKSMYGSRNEYHVLRDKY